MAKIDFWFSIGSTYTYLSVMRVREVARDAGLEIRWRPFNVRTIMVAQNNIPFKDKPVKTAYMWRDIARRATARGLPARLPAPYPLAELERANRVAILGMREGWGETYTVSAYRLWFDEGLEAGGAENLARSLAEAGTDPEGAREASASEDIGRALSAETDRARDLGVFGSPTFAVDGELFWGDDRLEDAVSWAKTGRVA